MNISKYSTYKQSGVDWLGLIPNHWDVSPNRAIFREVISKGHSMEQMLSVTIDKGVILQADLLKTTSKKDSSNEDKSNYKLLEPGDIAYNKMRAWQGALGASKFRGIISPAYIVIRPREKQDVWFFHHLMRTPAFNTEAERWSYGITSDQWSLRSEDFKCIYTVVPPPVEQEAIVRFIRRVDDRVNLLVKAKRKLIELLNEQKRAIIHGAVSKGLNPNVQMANSEVDWIGQIPNHWKTRPFKALFREVNERSTSGAEELLSVSHITGVTPRSQKKITMFMAESYVGHKLCCPDDIVANTMWLWMGALGVSKYSGLLSPSYAVYRPKPNSDLCSEFVDHVIRTQRYVDEYTRNSTGIRSSRLRLYPEQFLRLHLILPPKHEQEEICKYISDSTVRVNATILKTKAEIDLIREYRTRLVSDVVTGQLDVRGLDIPDIEEVTDEIGNEPEIEDLNDDLDFGDDE